MLRVARRLSASSGYRCRCSQSSSPVAASRAWTTLPGLARNIPPSWTSGAVWLVPSGIASAQAGRRPARLIVRDFVGRKPSSRNLTIIRSHFGPTNGVDPALPPREPGHEPPSFDRRRPPRRFAAPGRKFCNFFLPPTVRFPPFIRL